ncbi:odorant receptor 74a-like [Rhagoletis pomonella]|uniref:odorant receptor 74a-like n=1 Tax=Rhagoletis pomonella TaxID=28610 RepID=UPI00177ECFD5|nr:odorant receptor 74a-like [Rhagoletis pomonella]
MLYRPNVSNRELIPLSWPLAAYRLLNNICWPLRDGANLPERLFDRFCWWLCFVIFMQHNDAELRYIVVNRDDLDQMLTCVPEYLILIEIHIRAFQQGLKKDDFKTFLKKFYAEVYVDKSSHPKLYANIQQRLRPIWFFSALYYMTLSSFFLTLLNNNLNNAKEPLYKMYYPFDITPYAIYVAIVFSNIWVGLIVITTISGEDNLLSEVMLHLNGRFLLLQQKLRDDTKRLLDEANGKNVADDLSRQIVEAIRENERLYKFAKEFEREFSFRIFTNLSFSAMLLCALGFKVYTNPMSSFGFMFWICAKVMEMLLIGQLGSTLIATTNQISSAFYESSWELVIHQSKDSNANVRLMKLLVLAIGTSQKPFTLSGLNYFSVSLTAVLKILQGAGSYFTFLTSLR